MRKKAKNTVLFTFLMISFFGLLLLVRTQAAALACEYWVDPAGSNANPGTFAEPWATLEYAYYNAADNSCTVWFNPGTYDAASSLVNPGGGSNRFSTTTTFKSVQAYKAILQNPGKVLDFQGVQNMIFEGFEIKQTTPAPEPADPMIDFHRRTSPVVFAQHITFRNNIIHDANDKDIALIKGGVQFITFENNIFFNQGANEEILDINSVLDMTVRDNIFFNNFTVDGSNTKSLISIRDTNGDIDGYVGSERISIQRNVFLNWQGYDYAKFIQIGDGGPAYHTAKDIKVENNLMIGNSNRNIGDAIGVSGAKDVSFVNNTITGDLPASSYAMEIIITGDNPLNENIYFINNIWSDPTGSMGACFGCGGDDFSDGDPASSTNLVLDNNLYYNGGDTIPSGDVLSPLVDDANRVVGDPGLNTNQSGVVLPLWNGTTFLSGNATVREEFLRLVNSYGSTSEASLASGAADAAYSPPDDILGNLRPSSPSMGAYDPLTFGASITITKSSNTNQSMVGDDIQFTVNINNTSTNNSPDLLIDSIVDSLQGDLTNPSNTDSSTCGSRLAPKTSCSITYTYTVKAGDSDPLVNTALIITHPEGHSFNVAGNDSKTVELFQPGITLEKSSDVLIATLGDEVIYTIFITNTSSSDSPDLLIDSISDTLQGDLTDSQNYDSSSCGSILSPSSSCMISYTYTIQSEEENPLTNTAEVQSHPSGYTNDVDASDSVSINIGQVPEINLPLIFK